ncbi:hypothetical protein [Streptomyces sp. BRA346]|uniref:hypothetical protein n=1 Tax=Streptomyces sp. BRA346 TaxID=2878199 RepID=UPI004063D68B
MIHQETFSASANSAPPLPWPPWQRARSASRRSARQYGSARGVGPSRSTTLTPGTDGVPARPEARGRFDAEEDGAVWVLRGSADGNTAKGATSFSAPAFGLTFRNGRSGSVLGYGTGPGG